MRETLLSSFILFLFPTLVCKAYLTDYQGDVTDVRILGNVKQHPDSWRIWQPSIVQWNKKHLIVAFGAMTNGKKDMGDIFP